MKLLPSMSVEFYPNTGMEIGWVIALERELKREGWIVSPEVVTAPGRHVDLLASLAGAVVVIEVKAKAAGPAAVAQLDRYLRDVQQDIPWAIGVLAAPSITSTVIAMPDDMYFLPLVRT